MIRLKVNGVERSFEGNPDLPLLWYLRDVLGLTGTKYGCGMALCGVHRASEWNGDPVVCHQHEDGGGQRNYDD